MSAHFSCGNGGYPLKTGVRACVRAFVRACVWESVWKKRKMDRVKDGICLICECYWAQRIHRLWTFISGMSTGVSVRVSLPFPPFYILLDFFLCLRSLHLFSFLTHLRYNYILLSPALNPLIPPISAVSCDFGSRTAVLVIADAASLALKSFRRSCKLRAAAKAAERQRYIGPARAEALHTAAVATVYFQWQPKADADRSPCQPGWPLDHLCSLLPLSHPTSCHPTQESRERRERQKPRETESIYTKSTRDDSEDPDPPSNRLAKTHTPSRVLRAQHCQHSQH